MTARNPRCTEPDCLRAAMFTISAGTLALVICERHLGHVLQRYLNPGAFVIVTRLAES